MNLLLGFFSPKMNKFENKSAKFWPASVTRLSPPAMRAPFLQRVCPGRIQDFGQGAQRSFYPRGGLEPTTCSKLSENCMIFQKNLGDRALRIRLCYPTTIEEKILQKRPLIKWQSVTNVTRYSCNGSRWGKNTGTSLLIRKSKTNEFFLNWSNFELSRPN